MYSGGCGCEVVNTQYWWRPLIQRPQSSGSFILEEDAVQLRFFLLHHATSKPSSPSNSLKTWRPFFILFFCCAACLRLTADCIFTFLKEFKACFHYLLVAIVWGFPLITTEWPEAKLPFSNPSFIYEPLSNPFIYEQLFNFQELCQVPLSTLSETSIHADFKF